MSKSEPGRAPTLAELAARVGGALSGDGATEITAISTREAPLPGSIVFVTEEKALRELESSVVAAVIVPEALTASSKPLLRVRHPKLAWAMLLGVFFPKRSWQPSISPRAHVSTSAKIAEGVCVEDFAYIGERVTVGKGTVIRAHVYVDDDASIGEGALLHPHVMIYDQSSIGNRVILHAGCVVGADGFGYVFTGREQLKVPQVGRVVIEDDCEIGANTTIDRATFGETRIRRGAKLDNLVQVAHNVDIGEHTVICAQVGVSGSSKIGSGVTLAGQVGLGDHVEIGDGVIVGAQAGLPTGKKVPPGAILLGSPARPIEQTKKQVAAQLRSAQMFKGLQDLKRRVAELERDLALAKNLPK